MGSQPLTPCTACRLTNQGLLFDVDSHNALIMELKNKLSAIPEGGGDAANEAVAQWLGGIRPALDEAVQDIQDKKAFLVCIRAVLIICRPEIACRFPLFQRSLYGLPI